MQQLQLSFSAPWVSIGSEAPSEKYLDEIPNYRRMADDADSWVFIIRRGLSAVCN